MATATGAGRSRPTATACALAVNEAIHTLKFKGLLKCEKYGNPQKVLIGDNDVLEDLRDTVGWVPWQAIVQFGSVKVEGELTFDEGMTGYGTYTPGEAAKFVVGDTDLLDALEDLDGQELELTIAVAARPTDEAS